MSSNPIPKEQQSAYQRWEMASFKDDQPTANTISAAQMAEQIVARREEARQQGYETGLAEGRAAGLEQGRAQAEQERARLQEITSVFFVVFLLVLFFFVVVLLKLALDLAKAMLKL